MHQDTILVADDDHHLLQALRVRLEAEGFTVHTVQDAYQAVAMARRTRPDLIVLDINMPAGDGFSAHQRIQTIDELAGVPVIYMTGAKGAATQRRAQSHHAFAVLHKPFETALFLDTVWGAMGYAPKAEPVRPRSHTPIPGGSQVFDIA